MRTLWLGRRVAAPVDQVWELLVDTRRWPEWGPSVRAVEGPENRLGPASRGRLATMGGLRLPFVVTAFEPGRRWAWRVAGLPATDRRVEPGPDGSCRVSIGVPWPAAPYLAVVRRGLCRLAQLAEGGLTIEAGPQPVGGRR